MGDSSEKSTFDESQHKILNAELKYLYTAITRAKCNLWIYDNSKNFSPIFEYWRKKELISVIHIGDETNKDFVKALSAKSSLEDWKSQGDYFKKTGHWEQAMKCYQNAMKHYPEAKCSHLEQEVKAYYFLQRVPASHMDNSHQETRNALYLQAAHAFLKSSQFQHNHLFLENAAKCLVKVKNYSLSSHLYLHLGQVSSFVY